MNVRGMDWRLFIALQNIRAIAALRLFQCPFHLNNNSNKLDGVGSLACGPIQIHQGWGLDSDGGLRIHCTRRPTGTGWSHRRTPTEATSIADGAAAKVGRKVANLIMESPPNKGLQATPPTNGLFLATTPSSSKTRMVEVGKMEHSPRPSGRRGRRPAWSGSS